MAERHGIKEVLIVRQGKAVRGRALLYCSYLHGIFGNCRQEFFSVNGCKTEI